MAVILSTALLIIISQALAQNCDLKMESFLMINPDPSTVGIVYETGVPKRINSASMYVRTNGPENLPATTTSARNYDVKMYISALDGSGNMVDPVEVTGFDPNDGGDLRSEALSYPGGEHFYGSQFYDIEYPSVKCQTHSHLCVRIERESASYTDSVSSNDHACLKFVSGSTNAGRTNCSSEVAASDLAIIPTYANYSSNSSVDVTFSIDLENQGGTEVPGGPSNIGFQAFIADSKSASECMFVLEDTLTLGDLSGGINEWHKTTYSGNQVSIQIPKGNCECYKYFCVQFEKGESATYEDAIESNNVACLPFGVSGIGPIDCLGEEPTTANPPTEPVKDATTPNVTTTTDVLPTPQEGSGYISLHVGAVAGIAIGCAVVGAGGVLSFILLRSYLSKRAGVHPSPESGNADKPKVEKKPEKTKPPEEGAVTPNDLNSNGDAKPVAIEDPTAVDMA